MARILCIEDCIDFQNFLKVVLSQHQLSFLETVSEVLNYINVQAFDCDMVLLDLTLPDGHGIKLLPAIKQNLDHKKIPCIVLSSEQDVLSKITAFGVGADDYICKPPDPNELRARIDAKLKFFANLKTDHSPLKYLDISIHEESMIVEIEPSHSKKTTIDLTPIEFKILRLLIQNSERVFSRESIIDKVWGTGRHITHRTVDAHVSHIRQKIQATNSIAKIETVMSIGYKITRN